METGSHPRTIFLEPAVSRCIEEIAADAGLETPPGQLAAQLAPALPDPVHAAIIAFRQGTGEGALLLHGIGPGDVPDSAESYADLPVAAPLLLGLVSLLGTPVGARDEWDGEPLTDIRVTPGLEATVSSKGGGSLPLHQESQHLESPPDGLALLTVRGGAPTRLASTRAVIAAMRASSQDDLVEHLRAADYTHQLPDSFSGSQPACTTPILLGPDETPELKVDLTTTRAGSLEGQRAFAALVDAVAEVAADIPLSPGDLLIFDNRRWLHGRGDLSLSSPDRWLVRSLFVYDAWRARDGGVPGEDSPLQIYA
jgi:L-asparagine oxygenase